MAQPKIFFFNNQTSSLQKKTEITDGILPTDMFQSKNLNYQQILPKDFQILITDEKIRR